MQDPIAFQNNTSSNFFQGIVVDIEEDKIKYCCKDEKSILPSKLRKSLKTALDLAVSKNKSENDMKATISEAFLRFFVETCGHYRTHIKFQNGRNTFEVRLLIVKLS